MPLCFSSPIALSAPGRRLLQIFFTFVSSSIGIWNIDLLYCRKVRRNPAEAFGRLLVTATPGRGEGSGGLAINLQR